MTSDVTSARTRTESNTRFTLQGMVDTRTFEGSSIYEPYHWRDDCCDHHTGGGVVRTDGSRETFGDFVDHASGSAHRVAASSLAREAWSGIRATGGPYEDQPVGTHQTAGLGLGSTIGTVAGLGAYLSSRRCPTTYPCRWPPGWAGRSAVPAVPPRPGCSHRSSGRARTICSCWNSTSRSAAAG